jgi:hypothetical protein
MFIKNHSKTTVAAIFSILLSFSCNKNFLNKAPLDAPASQTFWTNETNVQLALAGCYNTLRGKTPVSATGVGGFPFNFERGYLDGLTDIGYVYWGLFGISDMSLGIVNANSQLCDLEYTNCYAGIAACNYFLDNVDKATTVAAREITEDKGEVRFLRALYYFELANTFGGVPLYKTSPATPAAAEVAQSSLQDVLAFVKEDLDSAIAVLPDSAYTNGHAVKASAEGILTRVLLYGQNWTAAAATAQTIINSGKFSLYGNYQNMFLDQGQTNNPEIMFSCEYLTPDATGVYGYNIEYTAQVFLRQNFMDAYECTDGKPITQSPLYNAADPYANRDPRFYATIRMPGEDWPGFYTYVTFNPSGVENKKLVDTSIPGDYSHAYLNDWDFILLRYADILLMYAEAQNEASGPDGSVYSAINQVRARPGVNMPPVDETVYNTQDAVRNYIRHEREIEFPLEGLRYFDLKRWHIADSLLPTITDASGSKLVFAQKQYLWPFPQSELDINTKLVQNTGY